jgi:hypothetical protein
MKNGVKSNNVYGGMPLEVKLMKNHSPSTMDYIKQIERKDSVS